MRLLLLLSALLSALTGVAAPARAHASPVAASAAATVPTAPVRVPGLRMPNLPAASYWPIADHLALPLDAPAPAPRSIWMDRRRE